VTLAGRPSWRVRRRTGLLPPGFTKRFSEDGAIGTTYYLGVPIGRFKVRDAGDGSIELVYRHWPVVDVVLGWPAQARGPIDAAGYIRMPRGRRLRFCRFRLER
jgi:hypothetical protein